MKAVEDVVCCVWDYGTFLSIAEKLAESMSKVYFCSPTEEEYQMVRDCVRGTGLDAVERLDEPLDPKVLQTIDLFVFPDIGYGGVQRHLRDIGKAVWGNLGATDLELYRDFFLEVLDKVGLPSIHSECIVGLTALREYLKKNDNKWVKINRFRGNSETWEHKTYAQSRATLDSLAVIFGGVQEKITFIVQDHIESDMEIGYDGWCIDGKFPTVSFQGYEKKNELYLGSLLSASELPEEILRVNEALRPVLASYGYRDWWATEIRVADGEPYFIDPTPRMAGQTMEHQLENLSNFAEIVWAGAHGILIEPEFQWRFAAEATLHYETNTKDPEIHEEWKSLDVPPGVLRWMKMYSYCKIDNIYHFMAKNTDEIGVMIGVGDSPKEAIEHLKENLDELKELPVHANTAGFASLLESIEEAEKQGLDFGGPVPNPEAIYKEIS